MDANSIIAAIIRNSEARKIIVSDEFVLASPEFLVEEIEKYKTYLMKKSGLGKEELKLLITLLLKHIHILPHAEYENKISEAKLLMVEDALDVPYVAVYLALKCDGIWTNDRHYENKEKIKVFKTEHILKLLAQ
ncbi:MAG: PIN domain-containing protein [Candidatus Micrarchaeaceae archaeon]